MRWLSIFVCLALALSPSAGQNAGAVKAFEDMKEANTLLKTIAGSDSVKDFCTKFLQLDLTKFLKVLKGVSLAGDVLEIFINPPNKQTETIVKEIKDGFTRVSFELSRDVMSMKWYFGEKFFSYEVLNPVLAASEHMVALLESKDVEDEMNKLLFLTTCKQAHINTALEAIFDTTKQRLALIAEETHYNRSIFVSAKNTVAEVFFQTYALRQFLLSLSAQTRDINRAQAALDNEAENNKIKFDALMNGVESDFNVNFFPGTMKENIVKKMVEAGDNCFFAEVIAEKIKEDYPWREYVVIVFNEASGVKEYAQIGYSTRTLVLEKHKGKNVIVFMNTPNIPKNKKTYETKFVEYSVQEYDKTSGRIYYKGVLDDVAKRYAIKEARTQVAAIKHEYRPCMRQTHLKDEGAIEETVYFRDMDGNSGRYVTADITFFVAF